MPTVTISEAQARLPELLRDLQPGEEITIVEQDRPVAHVRKAGRTSWPCQAGSYRKPDFWMAPDFDATPEDFKEYLE